MILCVLLTSVSAPAVVGEWSDDSWLENIIGPERIANGDEFGCQGYEGVSTIEENWVIEACRDYLLESTNASRWGSAPISFGISGQTLDEVTAEQLTSYGFMIVGDMLSDVPEGLILANRNGASLEKGVANISLIESAEEDTLVSIYWRARIDDLRIREDKDAISWLEQQQLWLTTWGEWNLHRIAGESTATNLEGSQITSVSQSASSWPVPGTIRLQFDADVSDVFDSSGEQYPVISPESRKLETGWRQIEGGILLTQAPGTSITIELESDPESILSTPLATFNDHHHAVTIVGHHTTNLFQWAADFVDSELVFTWLIERPAGIEQGWFLPALALTILIAVPVTIRHLVRKDLESQ